VAKNALGRGFEGLIPVGLDIDSVAAPGEQVKQLSIDRVFPNPDQPRKEFDSSALAELANSIKQHGIIQPIIVTPSGDKYRIVAGERRFRAAQIAKLTKIPAIVRNHEALEELEIALVENVQRVDLSPLEQAVSIVRLRDQFSLSLKDIAKKLGKAETTVSNIIRLLKLPDAAIQALIKGQISEGHARAILSLKGNESLQEQLLANIIKQSLSVREAELFAKVNKKNNIEQKNSSINIDNSRINKISSRNKITMKVLLKKRGGVLNLPFKDQKELDKLLRHFE
jgi:ParB family chromosome partitioning protein